MERLAGRVIGKQDESRNIEWSIRPREGLGLLNAVAMKEIYDVSCKND